MTVKELVEQFDQLSADDQRELLEILKQRIPETDDDAAVDIHQEFRQAWQEVMEGEGIPLSELWDALDEE
jgi:hypothetical protein